VKKGLSAGPSTLTLPHPESAMNAQRMAIGTYRFIDWSSVMSWCAGHDSQPPGGRERLAIAGSYHHPPRVLATTG
jgi:hypothetical protein